MAASRVTVTVAVGARTVPVEELSDPRLSAALRKAGQDVARRLASIECPIHRQPPTDVRVHFDARGNADLKYESCCAELGKRVSEAL